MSVTMLRSFTDGERPDISEQTKTGGNTPIVMSASSILEDMLCMRRVESSAYTKLYQRDLFDGIEYPEGKLYEDIAVTAKLFDRAGHVAVMDQRDYWYRQRKGSIQNSGFGPRQLDLLGQLDEVRRLVETNYPDLMPAWQSKLQSALFNLYMKIPSAQAGKATGRRLWTMIRTNRMAVIRNRGARLDARLASLLSYFGPDVCRFAYRLSYLRRKAL